MITCSVCNEQYANELLGNSIFLEYIDGDYDPAMYYICIKCQ